jgi:GxxExxY protein
MIVDDKLVVESKSTQELHRSAPRQVYSYLHASQLRVGLLLHFGPEPQFCRFVSRDALKQFAESVESAVSG